MSSSGSSVEVGGVQDGFRLVSFEVDQSFPVIPEARALSVPSFDTAWSLENLPPACCVDTVGDTSTPLRCWLPGIPLAVARLLAIDEDKSLPGTRDARGKRGGFGAASEAEACTVASLTVVTALLGSDGVGCALPDAESVCSSTGGAS